MKRLYPRITGIRLLLPALLLAGQARAAVPGGSGYETADLALLIGYVLLALVFSFLCSVAEAVLLSITPSYIAGLEEQQPEKAALLRRLKQDDIDHSLAAILTLNTIAHTVGAVGAGAQAAVVFGNKWVGLFSAILTLLILFFTEIIPKTLGATYWRRLSGIVAVFVRFLIKALYPLILISEKLTKLIARQENPSIFSRDELVAMAEVGQEAGHIREHESRIMRNLFQLGSLRARDVMTPRTVIAALPEDMTVAAALAEKSDTPFSRLPVHRGTVDDITGFILKDDMLLYNARGEGEVTLDKLKRDIAVVIETMPLHALLESMLDQRRQIVLVVNEYGETQGLVTLEDVVETLLGMEIVDEMDKVEDMQALAREQWRKRARALGIEVDEAPEPEDDAGSR